ncbi:hypothetical protein IAG44_17710 [Streptomyces roseirectus]|uniref:Uncharacterized protein n=1 Tax=Streptomyces roseirectus TaxID=2768066 RepID=A0A7H0IE76_9ACTN|nr:hypothetical protein [Streptomyces roseirectus]QNP71092.1 hypothetical protein IAG44_17710 [Streptomyces roseirectus]
MTHPAVPYVTTAAGASLGWWTSHASPGDPVGVLALALALCCLGSAWRAGLAGFAVDRTVRLVAVLTVHPVLALALLPLCLPHRPPTTRPPLTGDAADAARAIRRIVRTAVEPKGWPELAAWRLMPLLVTHHDRHAGTVATATTRTAIRTVPGRLPLPAALLLTSVAVWTVPGMTLTQAQTVMLAVTIVTAA